MGYVEDYLEKWKGASPWQNEVQPHLVLCGKHDRMGNWLAKAAFKDGWQKRPEKAAAVVQHVHSGFYVGVMPSSLRSSASPHGMVVVDVDKGATGEREGLDDARRYVRSVLGEPAAACQTARLGWHLYYIVGESMQWTHRPWFQKGNGGGDIIYDLSHAVLYEPSVVFLAAASPTGSRVTRQQLDLLRGVEEIKAPAPKPIETNTDKDRQAATASLAWIPPDVEYNDWMRVGASLYHGLGAEGLALWDGWSRGGSKYQPGECEQKWSSFARQGGARVGISTLIWIARDNGAPRR